MVARSPSHSQADACLPLLMFITRGKSGFLAQDGRNCSAVLGALPRHSIRPLSRAVDAPGTVKDQGDPSALSMLTIRIAS